jgi:ATP-dependent DNA helicase RecG
MKKLRIFVSSVQKELEIERVAVAGWVSSDARLAEMCDVILFEKEPLSGKRISKPYLASLKSCQIYLLIIDCEYGNPPEFSATHEEYRFARENDMPMLVFIKGMSDRMRADKTKQFIDEIKADGHTYRRFHDRIDLQPEIRDAVQRVLVESFSVNISSEDSVAGGATESASMFEQQALDILAEELDEGVATEWLTSIYAVQDGQVLSRDGLFNALRQKGLVRMAGHDFCVQASGLIFLGKDPALRFPQCRIFADAFRGEVSDSKPSDQMTLSKPAPAMVEEVWKFVQKNTRHPMRVVGLTRVSLDEYPREAVREAVVNAVAHRSYEDGARQILIKLFSDRLEILSPGEPMRPLTLAKIKRGNCQPCSRNPVLGQYLNHLRFMDQRGSGIGRMKAAMLDHGLDVPDYDMIDGYFRVTLNGPGNDLDRLRIPIATPSGIPPAVEEQLSDRQRDILTRLAEGQQINSAQCMSLYGISRQAINADFSKLLRFAVIQRVGAGRSTHYVLSNDG